MGNVLVTGGAGFIGSHLCEALLRRGDRVVVLDNFDPFYPREDKVRNLAAIRDHRDFVLIDGDIRSPSTLDRAFSVQGPVDIVVHLAALAGVRPSILDPVRYQDVNVSGTSQVLEAMRRHRVHRMALASSSSVYGNNMTVPFRETDPVDYPISPYASTKRACELIAHTYHHLFGFEIACLRFFTVYGPRQRPDLAIHKFGRMMLEGKPIPVYGDGSTSRDYTYIDDILLGILGAMDKVQGFRIYNLGESQTTTLAELIHLLEQALGVQAQRLALPLQPGDVAITYADIGRAREELGYQPITKVSTGIPKFAAWLKQEMGRS